MPGEIELYFPLEPVAVQSARFACVGRNKIRSYQPRKVTDYKQFLRYNAANQLPEDFKLFDCALIVEGEFCYLPPKSMRKCDLRRIEDGEIVYKITKPDVDNLTKGTQDALNGVVWRDDAIIADYHIRKFYGMKPYIRLRVIPVL